MTSPRSRRNRDFGNAKRDTLPEYCRKCPVLFACNGECPKHRFIETPDGESGLNYLCAGYKRFFTHVAPYMETMARLLNSRRPPAKIMGIVAERPRREDAHGQAKRSCPAAAGRSTSSVAGEVIIARNDVRIPGDEGAKFDMLDLTGEEPDPYVRLSAKYAFSDPWARSWTSKDSAAPRSSGGHSPSMLTWQPRPQWELAGGYRTLEGGADNDSVYTFALDPLRTAQRDLQVLTRSVSVNSTGHPIPRALG